MSIIASLEIATWGKDNYIVLAQFNEVQSASNRTFTDYKDALKEMQRLLLREILRYETSTNVNPNRPFDWNSLPLSPESD